MSILSKLSRQENFTESEKNIVRYLLEHKDEMSNLTISKVTQDTFTSNASIMRLCKKLEVRGYRELRLQIIKESERQRQEGKPVDMDFPLGEGDSIDDITGAISDLIGETLQTMKGLSLAPALGRIAAWMREAPHVYYYAAGDTLLTVQGFANRLMKLGIRAMDADEHKEINASVPPRSET